MKRQNVFSTAYSVSEAKVQCRRAKNNFQGARSARKICIINPVSLRTKNLNGNKLYTRMVPKNLYGYVERNNFSLSMQLVKSYDQVHTIQMTPKREMENTHVSMVQ
jgi:hypothetical protein